MKRFLPSRAVLLSTAGALAVAAAAGVAWAHDDHERHERRERAEDRSRDSRRAPVLAAYEQECGGACHIAYPARMLPADSWRRMMAGLEDHYGSDASLDAATAAAITAYLDAYAGTGRRVRTAPPEDRITRSAWFERKHDEVRPAVWKRKAVGSPANCAACHPHADQGDFEEDDVRIPK